MAGSIRSVIAENGLTVCDSTQFWESVGRPRFGLPQVIRCAGTLRSGHRCATYGCSQREAVDKWLELNGVMRKG